MHADLIEEIQVSQSRDYITEAWDIGLTEETEAEPTEYGPQPTKEFWYQYFNRSYQENYSDDIPFLLIIKPPLCG